MLTECLTVNRKDAITKQPNVGRVRTPICGLTSGQVFDDGGQSVVVRNYLHWRNIVGESKYLVKYPLLSLDQTKCRVIYMAVISYEYSHG